MTHHPTERFRIASHPTQADIVRDFIRVALNHEAAASGIEHILADFRARAIPLDLATVSSLLRPVVEEVLARAGSEDWRQVASDLIASARDAATLSNVELNPYA